VKEWNGTVGAYDCKELDELIQRFEEPNDATKWDKPLFTMTMEDTFEERCGNEIIDVLFKQGAKPRMSTQIVLLIQHETNTRNHCQIQTTFKKWRVLYRTLLIQL